MTAFDTTEQLGTAIRVERKTLGMTQEALAMAAGVGLRFVVDLESGKSTVRLGHVLRVIEVLGLQLELTGQHQLPPFGPEGPVYGS
ncbi:helix-turn-helix transcriptional regulator [Pseudomonas japonica]|nr:helix-turn-helix transcriptional regulator [Pseudomonas japonica]